MKMAFELEDVRFAGKARARRIASKVASVPDAVKRTKSADGMSSVTFSAHLISAS